MTSLEISVPLKKPTRKRLLDPPTYVPWVRATPTNMPDTFLFWIPVSGFPIRFKEKEWITEFLTRFSAQLENGHGLRSEIFFQYKEIRENVADDFRAYALKCMMLMGLGRFADVNPPDLPTTEQMKEIVEKRKDFDFKEWIGDFLFWFVAKQPKHQREMFFGHGGMTTIFLQPDSKTRTPKLPFTPALRASLPVFQKVDVDSTIEAAYAMQDAFLEKSKTLFGKGLESRPEYPGIAFILPLLSSQHFFLASTELRRKWFELFDVYVNESRKDHGIILAFKKPEYEIVMLDVLESMRRDEMVYEEITKWRPKQVVYKQD